MTDVGELIQLEMSDRRPIIVVHVSKLFHLDIVMDVCKVVF